MKSTVIKFLKYVTLLKLAGLFLWWRINDHGHLSKKEVDVFVMTCKRDFVMSLATVFTFKRYFSHTKYGLFLNHDGTLGVIEKIILRFLVPDVLVIEGASPRQLNRLPTLKQFYSTWQGKKIINPLLFSTSNKVLMLDSDVLFVNESKEIIKFTTSSTKAIYAEDFKTFYSVNLPLLKRRLQQNIVPKLNASIIGFDKSELSLKSAERELKRLYRALKSTSANYFFIDQTFLAMVFGELKPVLKLPLQRYISVANPTPPMDEEAVSYHFPDTTKEKIYSFILRNVW